MVELQHLTGAFDPLTAHTEGVKMALIISLSRADLLEAAFSARLLAVYHTRSPPPLCHTVQPARLAADMCTDFPPPPPPPPCRNSLV